MGRDITNKELNRNVRNGMQCFFFLTKNRMKIQKKSRKSEAVAAKTRTEP